MICSTCSKDTPDWAGKDGVCTDCIIDAERDRLAEAEADELAQLDPWANPLADWVRGERNRLIENVRWAIDPLTTPLTARCQDAFAAYIRKLHRVTVDFTDPSLVEWPAQPSLEYA